MMRLHEPSVLVPSRNAEAMSSTTKLDSTSQSRLGGHRRYDRAAQYQGVMTLSEYRWRECAYLLRLGDAAPGKVRSPIRQEVLPSRPYTTPILPRIKAPALTKAQYVYSPEVRESAVLQFKFGNDGRARSLDKPWCTNQTSSFGPRSRYRKMPGPRTV
jgi:hypothetical protein